MEWFTTVEYNWFEFICRYSILWRQAMFLWYLDRVISYVKCTANSLLMDQYRVITCLNCYLMREIPTARLLGVGCLHSSSSHRAYFWADMSTVQSNDWYWWCNIRAVVGWTLSTLLTQKKYWYTCTMHFCTSGKAPHLEGVPRKGSSNISNGFQHPNSVRNCLAPLAHLPVLTRWPI